MTSLNRSHPHSDFEIRFQSLHHPGYCMAFECNASGQVNLDELPERARQNYFFARAMTGREFAYPIVARRG